MVKKKNSAQKEKIEDYFKVIDKKEGIKKGAEKEGGNTSRKRGIPINTIEPNNSIRQTRSQSKAEKEEAVRQLKHEGNGRNNNNKKIPNRNKNGNGIVSSNKPLKKAKLKSKIKEEEEIEEQENDYNEQNKDSENSDESEENSDLEETKNNRNNLRTDNQLSEYEKKRLETIKQNQAMLASLSLGTTIMNTLNPVPIKPATKKTIKKEVKQISLPTRTSRRLQGLKPKYGGVKDDLTPEKREDKLKIKEEKREEKLKESDLVEDGKVKVKDTFLKLISDLNNENGIKENEQGIQSEDNEEDLIINKISNLTCIFPSALKVCDERIYRMQFHPSKDKVLLAVGSKVGEVNLLDTTYYMNSYKDKTEINNDYDYSNDVFKFRPHLHTISGLKYLPNGNNILLTSSYDNTIKRIDLNQQEYITSYLHLDQNDFICSMDINSLNNNLSYFSTFTGNVGLHDIRTNGSQLYNLSNKKIGNISLNPKYEHIFSTSSLDRTVKIYDSRYLKEAECLYQHVLSLSINSAHFSSNGENIVTTSFENTLKVFNFKPTEEFNQTFEPISKVSHNCRTGRFVTMFQAKFHPDLIYGNNIITIGDMTRKICFYNAKNGKPFVRFANHNLITSIPAVTEYHPHAKLNDSSFGSPLASGNNSGKVLLLV